MCLHSAHAWRAHTLECRSSLARPPACTCTPDIASRRCKALPSPQRTDGIHRGVFHPSRSDESGLFTGVRLRARGGQRWRRCGFHACSQTSVWNATLGNVPCLTPSFLWFQGGSAGISRWNSPRSILKSSQPVLARGHVASSEDGGVGGQCQACVCSRTLWKLSSPSPRLSEHHFKLELQDGKKQESSTGRRSKVNVA